MDNKYSLSMRLLHWLMGVAIIGLLAVGIYMEGLPKEDPNKYDFYGIHKAIGVLVLAFVVIRILNRMRTTIPPLPKAIGAGKARLIHLGHLALYGFMLAMPISGIIMSQAGGHEVNVFGWQMPVIFDKNPELGGLAHEVHELAGYGLIVMLVMHVGAVVHHRMSGVPIFARIWF